MNIFKTKFRDFQDNFAKTNEMTPEITIKLEALVDDNSIRSCRFELGIHKVLCSNIHFIAAIKEKGAKIATTTRIFL